MKLDIVSYDDLLADSPMAKKNVEKALLETGIVGICDVPEFESVTRAYINAARAFSALDPVVKQQYAPDRDAGDTEGYELGAEWFKNAKDEWQIDDKKASFYAYVPDHAKNQWPREVDLKTPYLALGKLIFKTGKYLLDVMKLNLSVVGYGRMLHYHKENDSTNASPDWCGAHFDHGVLTGLVPAYYFRDGKEVDEPVEAGLHIKANNGDVFEKIVVPDKSILLFQAGEFGQLFSHDRIQATRHCVKKAMGGIERYSFALFYNASTETIVQSRSILNRDPRYVQNQSTDGVITFEQWEKASYAKYRAETNTI